jgi:hypothetical protein
MHEHKTYTKRIKGTWQGILGISIIQIYFELKMGFWVALSLQQYNTKIHISHKLTPLETNKNISQRYTNRKGHLTANEYSVENGKEINRSLIRPCRPIEL